MPNLCMAYADPLDDRNRAARRRHYEANKQQYLDRNKQYREERRKYLEDLKASTPCADCGQSYPSYVMDFDHRDMSEKTSNVSLLVSYTWKRMLAEIEKCDIVCANCHRERTHQQRLAGLITGV